RERGNRGAVVGRAVVGIAEIDLRTGELVLEVRHGRVDAAVDDRDRHTGTMGSGPEIADAQGVELPRPDAATRGGRGHARVVRRGGKGRRVVRDIGLHGDDAGGRLEVTDL